jgi:hypothetical protein
MNESPPPLANGHALSPPDNLESDIHDTPDHQRETPLSASDDGHKDSELSDNNSDVDAEGSVDDDYNDIGIATNGDGAASDAPTTSTRRTSSSSSLKRKPGFDEAEHMNRNPELYGIRRSVSAHSRLVKLPSRTDLDA